MKSIKIHIILFGVLLALLFQGCVKEHNIGDYPSDGERIRFELFARTGSYGVPAARAGANENTLDKTPWVLVFAGTGPTATFVEAVKAELDIVNNRSYVYLTKQTGPCQLLVLANLEANLYIGPTPQLIHPSNLDDELEGQTLSYARANLMTAALVSPAQTTAPFIGQNLDMSDEVDVDRLVDLTIIPDIELKRTVGKLMVENTDTDFTFYGITAVINAPIRGRLSNPTGDLTYNTISGHSNLTEYSTTGYTSEIAPAVSNSTETNPLYLYESECAKEKNNTYIIIKGAYKGEDFYYKMALVDDTGAQLDIRRNVEYTFTITAVTGRGYYSVADAKASVASNTNLNYFVKVTDGSGFEIMSNNSYYVAVSNSHFDVYAPATGGATAYTAFTYIHNCTINFPVKKTITSNNPLMTVSSGSPIAAVPTPTPTLTATPVLITLANGFTEGELTLELGSLKKVITVRRHDRLTSYSTPPAPAPSTPTIAIINSFMPLDGTTPPDNRYVSAYTIDANGIAATPPAGWLQLAPSGEYIRNDPYHIYVDNGKIDLRVANGTNRTGYVYVTTKNASKRIKVCITQ